MTYRINIAATRADWIDLFRKVKGDELLRFYPTQALSLEEIVPHRLEDLQGLGSAKGGVLVREDSFLAVPVAGQMIPREIRQSNGIIRYGIDQLMNLDSFIFRPGGSWENECFVVGGISSLYNDGIAASVAKKIRSNSRKMFQSSNGYRIGPDCHLLYSHYRFTADCRY